MSNSEIAVWAGAAALLFWGVGAYNRLVRLRGDIVQRFAPVDAQFKQRHAMLMQQLDALAPVLANASALAENACAHARLHPGAAGAITSLRLAEEILTDARARLPVPTTAGTALPELRLQLATIDTTLAFARGQFNESVAVYNHAIRQFPTRLLAGLFGFRAGGLL
jgi:LemA protein